jgi:hypothetical protein
MPAGGLSLTELLVAIALLSTATAGGLAAYTRAGSSRREAAITQELHERAQYVFATLEPELQMAGYFGGSRRPAPLAPGDLPASATGCGEQLVRRLDLPLQAFRAWPLSCEPRGGGVIDGTDVLAIRRLSARLAAAPERGRAQWLGSAAGTGEGSLHWWGDADWTAGAASRGAELRDLIVRAYYVARGSDGNAAVPALRVKTLTSIAGTPAFIDTEVMQGVEDLQVEVLPDAAAPRAVRIRLRVRADTAALWDGVPPTLEATRQFHLRNAAD